MKPILFFFSITFLVTFNSYSQQTFNKTDVAESLKATVNNTKPDSLKTWKLGSSFNSNFTNTQLSNWAAGGQNALTLTNLVTGFANYKNKNNTWNTNITLGYGINRVGDDKAPFRKSDDKIIFTSVYGRKINKITQFTGLLDFRSQFAPGYSFNIDAVTKQEKIVYISNFLAPGYLVASIGYEYKPNDKFFVILSPLTSKSTFVLDDILSNQGAFGVKKGNKYRAEFGAYLNTGINFKIMKNITFKSTGNLFMNYKTPALIDVNWDNIIILQVNKYIATTFSTSLIYDDDIAIKRDNGTKGPALQFKQVLAVGLTIKLL